MTTESDILRELFAPVTPREDGWYTVAELAKASKRNVATVRDRLAANGVENKKITTVVFGKTRTVTVYHVGRIPK